MLGSKKLNKTHFKPRIIYMGFQLIYMKFTIKKSNLTINNQIFCNEIDLIVRSVQSYNES